VRSDQTQTTADHVIRELLAEGLDLCVRARTLDEQISNVNIRKHYPGCTDPVVTKSMTPHLWVQDQYDRDLADWEARARKALS
jgi:hypothetical protein